MPQMEIVADPLKRALAFIHEYRAAPPDADIEIRIGTTEAGEPCVVVNINAARHGFTANEARKIADIAEGAVNSYPIAAKDDTTGLPNLILALRFGADKAEAALSKATHGG